MIGSEASGSCAKVQPGAHRQAGMGLVPREACPPGSKARGPEVTAGRKVHIPADTTVSGPGGTGPLVAKPSFMQPPEGP